MLSLAPAGLADAAIFQPYRFQAFESLTIFRLLLLVLFDLNQPVLDSKTFCSDPCPPIHQMLGSVVLNLPRLKQTKPSDGLGP